jgi:hypothetical protein
MPLFTIVADFQGGTYLTQVEAENERQAASLWPESKELHDIAVPLGLPLRELGYALSDPEATPVGDLRHCWSVTADVEDQVLLLHIIRTTE